MQKPTVRNILMPRRILRILGSELIWTARHHDRSAPACTGQASLRLDLGLGLTEDTYTASISSLQPLSHLRARPFWPASVPAKADAADDVPEEKPEAPLSPCVSTCVSTPELSIPVSVSPVLGQDRPRTKMDIKLDFSQAVDLPENP